MKIRCACLVRNSVELLRHMISHYRDMGVSIFEIHLYSETPNETLVSDAKAVVNDMGVEIASVVFGNSWQQAHIKTVQQSMKQNSNDWYVLAEQEELQSYSDIDELVNRCETYGYDHVFGCYIDRLGPDGIVPRIHNNAPLWDQMPLGASLTDFLGQTRSLRVALVKGGVRLQASASGWQAMSRSACPVDRCLVPTHRFRWTFGLLESMRETIDSPEDSEWSETVEKERFIHYVEQNGGKIDIRHRSLRVSPCDRQYEAWESLKDQCRQYERTGLFADVLYGNGRQQSIRLNIGGPAVGVFHGNVRGKISSWDTIRGVDVSHAPPLVYLSCRYGEFSYRVVDLTPNTPYAVKLHFAENGTNTGGPRRFNVALNGEPFVKELDVEQEAGGRNRPLVISKQCTSSRDATITLDFTNGRHNSPMVSGIEIVPEA